MILHRVEAACALTTHRIAALLCESHGRHFKRMIDNIISKIGLRQLMRNYLKNNPAKFQQEEEQDE